MRSFLRLLMGVAVVGGICPTATAQEQVTFTKNVAPILQQRCQVCHRPEQIAPMSLITYQETRPFARAIKQQVAARIMPPWHINKNVGIQEFEHDESLTDKEIETIVKWVDGGAIQGNPADMPPPRKFPDGQVWVNGEPDLKVTLPQDVIVKATGPDWWPDITVDPHLTEDRYIKWVQIIPNKGYDLVHHIRTNIVRPDDVTNNSGATDGDLAVGEQGLWLSEYAIGKGPDTFREGTGRLMTAGSRVNFQFHIHPSGKERPMNVVMGLKFYPKGYVPKHAVITTSSGGGTIDIRPGDPSARSDGYKPLLKPARIMSFQPHMHNRGKAQCMEAIYPNGKRETLTCANFQFNWMRNYVYADDAAPLLPAGTILHTMTWHDNSPDNKFNRDPNNQITWGSRTMDEMGHVYLNMYYMTDEEYKQEMEERKAKQSKLTSSR